MVLSFFVGFCVIEPGCRYPCLGVCGALLSEVAAGVVVRLSDRSRRASVEPVIEFRWSVTCHGRIDPSALTVPQEVAATPGVEAEAEAVGIRSPA